MLQKINLNLAQKEILEEVIGLKIYLRNSFDQNQLEIQNLLDQGLKNSLLYLDRNRLGQKLLMFDENKIFNSVINFGKFLQLKLIPRRIECYDISHLQGKFVYGSMVVFIDGRPVSKYYKIFKCKEQNNDFENHKEVLRRRLVHGLEYKKKLEEIKKSNLDLELDAVYPNPYKLAQTGQQECFVDKDLLLIEKDSCPVASGVGISKKIDKSWQLPDLIIVDGGKGQLSSDYSVLVDFGIQNDIVIVSIAKREEEIFVTDFTSFGGYKTGQQGGLIMDGDIKFLAQRIRDEAHRFAIKNNRNARLKTIRNSSLDDIDGVGEMTKNKILTKFGSVENLVQNIYDNPQIVRESLGNSIFDKIYSKFVSI